MHVDVDMSGRVEETNRPTALALATGMVFCIAISAADKRSIIEIIRRKKPHWSRKQIHVRFFATLLFLLLRDHIARLDVVMVDPEYPGYEQDIREWVMRLCRQHKIRVYKEQIAFERVGKKSPAHQQAIQVFRGELKAHRTVRIGEVLTVFGL